ncbi:MAG: TlpA disulfide reductase family protein [Desulfobacterales bacterium]
MHTFKLIVIFMAVLCLSCSIFFSVPAYCGDLPKKGENLPLLSLQAPSSTKEMAYLGIKDQNFRIGDIACQLLLLEVIGVYCPGCYRQAPLFNNLYNRIEKGKLKGQVKMLAVAAGGSVTEIQYLNEQGPYRFPVVPDPLFSAHKLLGEPRTPFTMLVDPLGKVLYTHVGVVEDIDAFLKIITGLVH